MQTEYFKVEGIHILKHLLKPGDWMIKVSLRMIIYIDDTLILSETESLSWKLKAGPSGEPGLHHQLPKIHSQTFKEDRISWLYSGLHNNGDQTARQENEEDEDGKQETLRPGQPSSHNLIKTTGQTQSCHTGNHTCFSVLPQLTVLPTRSPGGRWPRLCDAGQTTTGMHRGIGVVGETPDQLERMMSDLTIKNHH